MVSGEVLSDLRDPVSHISNGNGRGSRLCGDELANILQLRPEADVGTVIEQDNQVESGVLSLRRDPVHNLVAFPSLVDHYVLPLNGGNVGTVLGFNRN